jgi:hypothetical protein
MDEATGKLGGNEPGAPDTWNFSIQVAKLGRPSSPRQLRTRKIALRSATFSGPGGVFDVFSQPRPPGLGGTNGTGNQFVSGSMRPTSFARSNSSLPPKTLPA